MGKTINEIIRELGEFRRKRYIEETYDVRIEDGGEAARRAVANLRLRFPKGQPRKDARSKSSV